MNHPEVILRTLDRHLGRPARLILYGRAALSLGFPDAPVEFAATMDVDAILPSIEMAAIEEDDDFWEALEKTNTELESDGLYMTHLFVEDQLILTPDWLDRLQPVHLKGLRHLRLHRPDTGDLILTKMMRVDPQDRDDIRFLMERMPGVPIGLFLSRARIPDIPEIRDAFDQNCQWLRKQTE